MTDHEHHILVVEPDANMRTAMEIAFEELGIKAKIVKNIDLARAELSKDEASFDAIISSDIVRDSYDSLDLLNCIKSGAFSQRYAPNTHIPFIIVSTDTDATSAELKNRKASDPEKLIDRGEGLRGMLEACDKILQTQYADKIPQVPFNNQSAHAISGQPLVSAAAELGTVSSANLQID